MPSRLKPSIVQDGLCTRRFGRIILFSHEKESTNKWARELALRGAQEGTAVVAETQTKGYGRRNKEWFSPLGGLYFSLILRPKLRPAETVEVTFLAGLAVAEVLRRMFGLRAETKWPNDVLVNRRKICGILTEMNTTGETVNFVVVGVGINANCDVEKVFPSSLSKTSTSLQNELQRKVQMEKSLEFSSGVVFPFRVHSFYINVNQHLSPTRSNQLLLAFT